MSIIFWITFFINLVIGFYSIIVKKNYFNLLIFLLIGIYIPLFMYMLGWSELIDKEISWQFYLIFIYLNLGIIISNIVMRKNDKNFRFKVKNTNLFLFFNIVYVLSYLAENYMGSGSFFPVINGIDIHTYSAPLISYITRSIYIVLLGNLLFFIATKKKRYVIFILIILLIPIVTRAARIQSLVGAVEILFFYFYYIYCKFKKNNMEIKKGTLVKIIILCVLLMNVMIKLTEYRMNQFGKYELKYEETIQYSGPEFMKKPLAIYYGYFPLSFNNLNINIKYTAINHNYIGLYSFKSIYYGIFQLDNILNLNPYEPEGESQLITSKSATVPTGFYDYYYDFGIFSFIPIYIAIGICIYLYLKMQRSSLLVWRMLYFYYAPLWVFMSFQNIMFSSTQLITMLFCLLFYKSFIIDI